MAPDSLSKRGITSAILLSTGSPVSLKVLYNLQHAGLKTRLLDLSSKSAAHRSRYLVGYEQLKSAYEPGQGEALAGSIRRLAEAGTGTRPIETAIVPSDVESIAALHDASPYLDDYHVFPVSSRETLATLDDKWRFQKLLQANAISVPKGTLVTEPGDLEKLGEYGVNYPIVLKSLSGESSHGVFFAQNRSEAREIVGRDDRHSRLPLVAQAYVAGTDGDISVMCKNGEVTTHILQLRKSPNTLEFAAHEPALELARKLASVTRFTGVANIDIRIDQETGETFAIECNPRFWYTLQASLWRGINFVEEGLRVDDASATHGERVVPETGVYHLHGELLKQRIWNPFQWSSVPAYNVRGLMQAALDPLPFLPQRNA